MLKRTSILLAAGLVAAAAIPVLAQNMRMPDIKGIWNPAVGVGAVYEHTGPNDTKSQMTIEIIGKEDVSGTPGYWMEIGSDSRGSGQMSWVQALMVVNGNAAHIEKMVVELPGRGAFIFPATMMAGRGMNTTPKATIMDDAKKVGSESVTTPAGTFDCDHWKSNDGNWDVWLSSKVQPWGMVKSANKDGTTYILVKTVSDAKSHITETPQVFDPSMFGRRGE